MSFQNLLSDDINWLRDTGVLTKIKFSVITPPMFIPDPKVRINQPLSPSQLGLIMIISVGGYVLSILTFMIEMTKGRNKRNEREDYPQNAQTEMSNFKRNGFVSYNQRWGKD